MKSSMMAKISAGFTAAVLAIGMAGCSSSGSGGASKPLTIAVASGPQINNNNPFVATSAAVAMGYGNLIYEPLAQTNLARPDKAPVPWLANSFKWATDYKSVVITARDGVKWSDGQAFSAKDIAYTFGLIKKTPAFNVSGLPLEGISTSGKTATITFSASQFVNQLKVLSIFIVPEHIWSKISDPTRNVNAKPVGTGPYQLKTWTQQAVTMKPNNSYWGGKPPVPVVRYSSYNDNSSVLTGLLNGAVQWTYIFIPNMEKTYLSKSPTNNSYMPTGLGIDALWLNTAKTPFDNVALRKAINMVIDRKAVHVQGFSGFKGLVDSVTGLPTPAGDAFTAADYKGKKATVDVAGAKKVLTDAGYTYKGSALIDPKGAPVTFSMIDPAGWSDYLQSLQIIAANVAKIGITAKIDTATVEAWSSAMHTGNFQATLAWTNTGSTPWEIYSNIMDGQYLKPMGADAQWNFGRFESPEATKFLHDYANTTSAAERTKALDGLQKIMVEQVPVIPLASAPQGGEYSTKYWTGFPSEKDPYALATGGGPSVSQVIMKLRPVK